MIGIQWCFRVLCDVKPGDCVLIQRLDTVEVEAWHTEDIKAWGRMAMAMTIPGPKDWCPGGLIPSGWKPLLQAPAGKLFTLWVNDVPVLSGQVITVPGIFGFLADASS